MDVRLIADLAYSNGLKMTNQYLIYGKYYACHIAITQFNDPAQLIFLSQFIERTKLMLPGKGFGIVVRL